MGLFSKKECSICGGEIGLLGNKKLADGNCCKNCAALFSPYLADRRGSTVDEIRAHLKYRELNERALGDFHPTKIMGGDTKIYLDERTGMFIVTRMSDWQRRNPDLISRDQVIDVTCEIRESRIEEYRRAPDGRNVPYNPPRYLFNYAFIITIALDSPWFNEITFELTQDTPHSRREPLYHKYEDAAEEIRESLKLAEPKPNAQTILKAVAQTIAQAAAKPAEDGSWTCACGEVCTGKFCPKCGAKKPEEEPADDGAWTCECGEVCTGKFCPKCGAKKPEKKVFKCDKCGWEPEDPSNPPKFCPNCGDPFTDGDVV